MLRFNGASGRARRATWRGAALVLLTAVCPLCGAGFSQFPDECQKLYTSAWGAPAARQAALKLFEKRTNCPDTSEVSVRGRAALIAANLIPDASDVCYDADLASAVRAVCSSNWKSLFYSNEWHPHGEGVLTFHESSVTQFLTSLVLMIVLYICLMPHHVGNNNAKKNP